MTRSRATDEVSLALLGAGFVADFYMQVSRTSAPAGRRGLLEDPGACAGFAKRNSTGDDA